MENNLKKIKDIVIEFFQKTTFLAEVYVSVEEDNVVAISVKVEDPQVLIGERGQTLAEIQHLVRVILKRNIDQDIYFNLDINNYKQKKYEYLKEMVRSIVDEVFLFKTEKELAPMPAHERRIIHLFLKDRSDVITESIGEGSERRIVIRPKV